MTEVAGRPTFQIVCQGEGDTEVPVTLRGTRAEFDKDSARLTVFDGDQPVGGFIRVLRWSRKD